MPMTDEALYRRAAGGDEGALEALVYRYHGPLLQFLYRQSGDLHLAHDLVQETFARLIAYRGDPPRRFRPWIYAIAANLARDHFRSAYRRREQPSPLIPGGDGGTAWNRSAASEPGADQLLMRDAERREVVDALQALSPTYREALVLRYYHDLSMEEIAEVTGAPLGTIKSRIFHGLRRLRDRLVRTGGRQPSRKGGSPDGQGGSSVPPASGPRT